MPHLQVPRITAQVSKTVVRLGNLESNHMVQDNYQLIIYFSSMQINEVYIVQTVVNTEIKIRKCNLEMKVKTANKDNKKLKLEIQSTEQMKRNSEGNYQKISAVVALASKNVEEE